MRDRLYELSYQRTKTPVFVKDIGSILKLSGVVLQGNGESVIVMFPDASTLLDDAEVVVSDDRLMCEIIGAHDNPEYLDALQKIWLRKSQRSISGKVQQIIWVRDGLKCMYCGQMMGDAQLTIDHFIPLELGGENNDSNYLTACEKCNRDKGNEHPRTWCQRKGYSYERLKSYLAKATVTSP